MGLAVLFLLVSANSLAQHMLFHLLGAGQPIANFTSTSQTVAEGSGVWAPWSSNLSAWTRRRQIVVEGVGTSLSNFSVMVKLDSTRIDYAQTKASGADLRFADDSGALLSYEIESWNSSGTSIAWVKVPTLSAYPARNSIWMYYGNSAASDAQAPSSAWDGSYAKVMHLSGSGAIANSATITSSVGNSGTANNGGSGMSYAAGQVANGVAFDGTDDWIDIGSDASLNFGANSPLTFSVYFNTTDTSGPVVNFRELSTGFPIIGLYIGQNGASAYSGQINIILRDNGGSGHVQIQGPVVNDGNWHHLVLSRNSGAVVSLFVDGVSYGSASNSGSGGAITTTQRAIGSDRFWVQAGSNSANDRFLSGTVDQLEVSTVQRSIDWIQATYLSNKDLLTTFGSEQQPTAGAAIVTVQLNTSATSTITIPYTVSGTATAGTDHSRVSGNLTINGGSASGSLNTYVLRDNLVEGSETAILTLGSPTGATLGTDTVHTITITDEVLSPPDAIDDNINLTSLNAITISPLANDTDANGDLLTITAYGTPSYGTLTRVGQTLLYTPSGDFGGLDSFTYTITDGRGGSDTATINVNYQIPFTWIGSGADANWSTSANWLGGAVPGASDTAYFNNQCTTYCNPQVNANASVANLKMNTSFAGTITQIGANTITVTTDWVQRAGTFVGSSADISIGNTFQALGGSFTSTSGTLTYGATLAAGATTTVFKVGASATFNHNSGTVLARASRSMYAYISLIIDVPTDTIFNNLKFEDQQCGAWWYGSGGSWGATAHSMQNRVRVNGTLTHNCSELYGNFALYGNLVVGPSAQANYSGNNGAIEFNGSAAQTYTLSSGAGRTHAIVINKTGGTVTAGSTDFYTMSFTLTQGSFTAPTGTFSVGTAVPSTGSQNLFTIAAGQTFSHNSGTLVFASGLGNCSWDSTVNINIDTTLNLNNVSISGRQDPCYGGYSNFVLAAGDTINVLGNLTLSAGKLHGTWNVAGNISTTSTEFQGGTALITLNNGGARSISQVASTAFPGATLTMSKPTASVTQSTAVTLGTAGQALNLTDGTYDMAGFDLAVNGALTIGSNAKLLCNGGTLTYGSAVVSGEISCGPSIGITWTGLAGDGLWSTAGNWTNNNVPGASDVAYFNSKCTNCNATINSAVSVKGIVMASSYTGTITQGSGNSVTVGTSGWSIAGGTFSGGNSAVSVSGTLTISGGVYTATSGTTSLGSTGCGTTLTPLNMTAGVFNHGNGRLKILGGRSGGSCHNYSQIAFPAGFTAYDFETSSIATTGGWHSYLTPMSATTMTVAHNLYDNGHLYSVTFDVKGDVISNRNEDVGTGVIKFTSGADQYYDFASGSRSLPTVQINKASGVVRPAAGVTTLSVWTLEVLQGGFDAPSNKLTIGEDVWGGVSHNALLVSSGTAFNTNGGTIRFALARRTTGHSTQNISVPVGFIFNNVEIANTIVSGGGWSDFITSATTLSVAGSLTHSGKVNNANWNVSGNITVNSIAEGGTGTIRAVGTANQTISGTSGGSFPNFEIASTGGVVTFSGTLKMSRSFIYTSGTVDAATSTVYFYADSGYTNTLTPGAITFNNVTFDGWTGVFTLNGTMDVAGTLGLASITSSPPASINTGTVLARGPVAFTNYGVTGTGLIKVGGSSSQTVSGTSTVQIPNFEIASTGGTVTYSGTLNFNKSYTYTTGTVDAGTSTVQIATGNTSSQVFVPGPAAFNNLTLGGYNTVYTMTGIATANGTLTFNSLTGSPASSYNGGAIIAKGNVTYTNYGAVGNSTLSFEGTTNTTLSLGSSAQTMTNLVTVNKTGGASITLSTNYSLSTGGQDLTISGGTLDLGGFDLSVPDVITVGSGTTLKCSGGIFTSTSVSNSGTINCPGYTGYDYNWTGAGADTNWSTAANWAGGVAPSATSVLVFNDTYCGANCNSTIGTSASVKGIQMQNPYTGTLTQASGAALTVGRRGWTQAAGTFAGADASFAINGGSFILSGGTFNATSGTTAFRGGITISAGSFNAGTGTQIISGEYTLGVTSIAINVGSAVFNNLSMYSSCGYDLYTATLTGNLTVGGTLTVGDGSGCSGSTWNGGQVLARGNIVQSGPTSLRGSTVIKVAGSANQSFQQTGTLGLELPIEFASTGGTVALIGMTRFSNSVTYTSGTIDASTATLVFKPYYGISTVTYNTGSWQMPNLRIVDECGYDQYTATLSSDIQVSGPLVFDGGTSTPCSSVTFNGSRIRARGDVTIQGNTTSGIQRFVGSTILRLEGLSSQLLSQSGSHIMHLPLEIASTGGTVSLSGTVQLGGNVKYISGTVDAGTSTVVLKPRYGIGSVEYDTGPIAFNNLTLFNDCNYDVYTATLSSSLISTGTLTFDTGVGTTCNPATWNGYSWLARGNVVIGQPPGAQGFGGSTTLRMEGSTNATLSGGPISGYRGPVYIDKSSGAKVTMGSVMNFSSANQDLTITVGTLDMAGYGLTIARNISNSGTLKRGNSPSCGTLSYGGTYTGAAAICP